MKKIIYIFMSVLLGGSLVSAEQIQSIMFNPSRLGLYQQLRVTETMRVEGSVKAPVSVISGNSTVTVQTPFDISIVDGTRGTIYMPDTELQQSGQMGVFGGKAYFGGSVDSEISSLPEATWLKANQVRLKQLYLTGYSGATFDSDDANTKDQAGILNLGGNVIPHPDDACTGKLAWEDRQVGDTLYQVLAIKGCNKPEGGDTCTDSYGTASSAGLYVTDTCDGDTSNQFTCSGTAKECTDVYEASMSVGKTAAAADYLAWSLDSDFNTDKSFFVAAGSNTCSAGYRYCGNKANGQAVCCDKSGPKPACGSDAAGPICIAGQTPGDDPTLPFNPIQTCSGGKEYVNGECKCPSGTVEFNGECIDSPTPTKLYMKRTVKCCAGTPTPTPTQTCEENPKQAKCCSATSSIRGGQYWDSTSKECKTVTCGSNEFYDKSGHQCRKYRYGMKRIDGAKHLVFETYNNGACHTVSSKPTPTACWVGVGMSGGYNGQTPTDKAENGKSASSCRESNWPEWVPSSCILNSGKTEYREDCHCISSGGTYYIGVSYRGRWDYDGTSNPSCRPTDGDSSLIGSASWNDVYYYELGYYQCELDPSQATLVTW